MGRGRVRADGSTRAFLIAAAVAIVAATALISWKLPSALDRGNRASKVAGLATQLARIQAESEKVSMTTAEAQGDVQDLIPKNAASSQDLQSQEQKIADLKAVVARLKKEIAAIGN